MTIPQKLRNIEAMIHTVEFTRGNGADFDRQSEQLRAAIRQTEDIPRIVENGPDARPNSGRKRTR